MTNKKCSRKECRFFDSENDFCKYFGVLVDSEEQTCSITGDNRRADHTGKKQFSSNHTFSEYIEKMRIKLEKRGITITS